MTSHQEPSELDKDIALYGMDYGIVLPDGFISDIVLLIHQQTTAARIADQNFKQTTHEDEVRMAAQAFKGEDK